MPVIDMTGERYGRLTVIERDYTKSGGGKTYWKCRCDCGNITSVSRNNLKNGSIKSCGCLKKERNEELARKTLKDMTGQKIGRLTVLYRDESKPKGHGHKAYWICQCDCGNVVSVEGGRLRSGNTKSCGCLQRDKTSEANFVDISGQQFGFLIPLYPTGEKRWKKTIWHCKCLNCGGEADVLHSYLTCGDTKSCGCLGRSYGEKKIETILKDNNVNFKQEYSFDDLRSESGVKLRFDFVIFRDNKIFCLIEFQGDQHNKPCSRFGGEAGFNTLIKNDNLKRDYCKNHNLTLIEIPYKDKDKLSWEYLKEKCNL